MVETTTGTSVPIPAVPISNASSLNSASPATANPASQAASPKVINDIDAYLNAHADGLKARATTVKTVVSNDESKVASFVKANYTKLIAAAIGFLLGYLWRAL